MRGASLIGLVGMLTSGVVQAQTPDSTLEPAPMDAAPELPETPAAPVVVDPVPTAPEMAPIEAPILPEPEVTFEAPAPVEVPAAPAAIEGTESFIDPTGYSLGATERTDPTFRPTPLPSAIAAPSLAESPFSSPPSAVQVGPFTVGGGAGISYGTTTASVKNYYNRTIRPPARLGNGNISLLFPLAIPAPITSVFGWRIHPISGDQRFHSGTDLGAPMGTPVLAAYAGQVAIADFLGGYGLAVTLSHNKGNQETLYAHLSEIFVKPGEMVKQGMVIGRVGSTGNSTGPHLHFEFRQRTPDGWVVMDAGQQLEYALAQLMKAMQVGQAPVKLDPQAQPGTDFGEIALSNVNLGKTVQFTIPLRPQAGAAAPGKAVLRSQTSPRSIGPNS